MKSFLFSILTFASASAWAGEVVCFVNPSYSSAIIRWDDEKVTVVVQNPRGFAAMPQMEMPMSQEMIPMLKMQSEKLAALGHRFEYEWPRSKCQWSADDKRIVACQGSVKNVGDDNGIMASSMTTVRLEENGAAGVWKTVRLRFLFLNKGMYFAAIPFPSTHCSLKGE